MTQPPAPPRKRREMLALALIVGLAAWLRLRDIDFGLPALNDPDEPLFMMTAIDMLKRQSLNPGWFGHPATITLYCLAVTIGLTAGLGVATGRFADAEAFAQAVYADPGIAFLPARVMIACWGLACIWLVWKLGRRLGGERLGIAAAALLAVNAVHIHYSQVIRSDVQAGAFMLLATLSAVSIARTGRLRDHVLAGVFVGLACATKWPAALIALGPACAWLGRVRAQPDERWRIIAFCAGALATLFAASPYLLLDYPTVIQNLSGEARATHPGSTGSGFVGNLAWYLAQPLRESFGVAALALALVGLAPGRAGDRVWSTAVLPGFLAFLAILAIQALRWERWIVPLIPFLCLAVARGLFRITGLWRTRARPWIEAATLAALAWPMALAAQSRSVERAHDTRQLASAWIREEVPPGASILIEHAAFDILSGPWRFGFPLGSAGCVDVRKVLAGQVRYASVEKARKGSPLVDFAHVGADRLDTCRADYAVFSNYTRYPAGSAERRMYERVIAGGRLAAVFAPRPGASSGPTVTIFRIDAGGSGRRPNGAAGED